MGELERRHTSATQQLMGVGLADTNPSEIGCGDGEIGHSAQGMRTAYVQASRKVFSLRNDLARRGMQNVHMPHHNHLRAWRTFRHMTQEELAEAVGTTKAVISNLETGVRPLSAKWLDRFAPVLNTSAGYILDHDPNDLPTAVLDIWADIPEESRAQALRVLQSFKRTGTDG
nr:helix-turn-helix transcriptional regulator [uncultured Brevundimonas sp.]